MVDGFLHETQSSSTINSKHTKHDIEFYGTIEHPCGAATHKHFKVRVDNVLLACSNLRDLVDQPSTHLPNIIDVLSKGSEKFLERNNQMAIKQLPKSTIFFVET
jgi:hypothetical protein